MNPFAHKASAQRYAEARPYYHPVVIDLVRACLNWEQPVARALDVACGTGQSCVALKPLARRVVGADTSPEMLTEAPTDPAIEYVEAPAEQLPFPDEDFDLITVSSAFHWFEREKFLGEANRLLPVSNWLVIYENNFQGGKMKGHPEFREWIRTEYLAQFPSPPRHGNPLDNEEAEAAGFRFANRQRYSNDVTFTKEGLAHYLTTQSNIIAAVEEGEWSLDAVCGWLYSSLEPFFEIQEAVFEFGGAIWYLQKSRTLASN
ncbi:class I SAM-dependent methyltransferase [Candidatus Hydrogenedentota bacterium]